MSTILRKLNAEWVLRLSLGVMYIYSGFDILRHPAAWTWAVRGLPNFANKYVENFGVENFLYIQGAVEVIFGAVFILWFMPRLLVRLAGLVSSLEMLLITLLVGVDAVTFRDIGLIGPGLALFLML